MIEVGPVGIQGQDLWSETLDEFLAVETLS